MDQVLQNGRRKARPWTAQDQIIAEVAAACGAGLREIGRLVGWSHTRVRTRLLPTVAEKKRIASRSYYAANTDAALEYARRYRKSNVEKMRDCNRRYYAKNADKCRQYKRWCRQVNGDKEREKAHRWRKANLGKARQYSLRRSAWRRAARLRSLHPVTLAQIDARFALWRDRCAFCGVNASHGRNYGRDRLTVDHAMALTKGGLDEAVNIIPACTACNCSKNDSPIETWYCRQHFFTKTRWAKIQRHCPAAVVGQLPLALAA